MICAEPLDLGDADKVRHGVYPHVQLPQIVPHLPALHLLLTGPAGRTRRRRTRRGTDVRYQAAEDVICYLREEQITLTYDPAAETLHACTGEAAQTITLKAG